VADVLVMAALQLRDPMPVGVRVEAGDRAFHVRLFPSVVAERDRHTKEPMSDQGSVVLDGQSLTIDGVVEVARGRRRVALAPAAADRMNASRRYVDELVKTGGDAVYGINTGLGVFANRRISTADAAKLSRNLVLSHAVGVGAFFPQEVVRAAMLIRANSLAVGCSGVRPAVVETLAAMLNAGVHPLVPEHGSLGSSGDLAPLSHLALVFTQGEDSFDGQALLDGEIVTGNKAMAAAGIARLTLAAKEALALTNGTSFSAALAALAVADGRRALGHAELGTALVFEALLGATAALDERLHAARRHKGQQRVAARLRSLLAGSTLVNSEPRVQDAYSLRCVPQLLGPVHDALDFVASWVENEINAVTDNPLLFPDAAGRMDAVSGGNFHGEVLSFASDYLGIALAEVGAVAERQIHRLLHGAYSFGLPAMLVANPEQQGLNSGLMMPHYTAVSLVLENQTLAHPDSVHSLPTSAGQEDANANSQTAAKHLRKIVENVEDVLAILFFTAAQAVDLRLQQMPGARLADATAAAHRAIRERIPFVDKDRLYQSDIAAIRSMLETGALLRD
jgi:histidine ammonia-lyase